MMPSAQWKTFCLMMCLLGCFCLPKLTKTRSCPFMSSIMQPSTQTERFTVVWTLRVSPQISFLAFYIQCFELLSVMPPTSFQDVTCITTLLVEAMPLLMPDEKLMTKWLPAVRWGSLEFDRDRGTGAAKLPACLMRLGKSPACFVPWMNQSTLQSAVEGRAAAWIGATDYYRFPHILHFHSVASLVAQLRQPLATTSLGMRRASQEIRLQTLSWYRELLGHLLGFKSDLCGALRSDILLELISWISTKHDHVLMASHGIKA